MQIANNPARDATPHWWCHEHDHPAWCVIPHSRSDRSSDRDCVSAWERQTSLTHGHAQAVAVYLYQPYGACTPRIVLTPVGDTRAGYELSCGEAEAVSRALLEGVFLLGVNRG